MKLKDQDKLKHRAGSQQHEDQMTLTAGTPLKKGSQKAHPQRRVIQRMTTQRGTDRD